jgi:dehydrogenase/reductase SDR family protein 7B
MRSGYTASKHAVVGFMDSIRLELATANVHVMTVLPGFINTDLVKNSDTIQKEKDSSAAGLPPEQVAKDILKGLESRAREVVTAGFKERLALFLSRTSPKILDALLLKVKVT